jgi:UDP-3-O-[3-hydroxymyristoyl] glucosamine N-acyltransferase
MTITLGELADRVGGRVRGDSRREINGAAAIDKAGPSEITFAGDEKNLRLIKTSQAGACLVGESLCDHALLCDATLPIVFVPEPLQAFMSILRTFRPARPRPDFGVSPAAHVDPSARIGRDCNIYPGAVIGADVEIGPRCDLHPGVCVGPGCRIGADCELHPHVVLYPDVMLGHRVIIHANAVIGADGFGYRLRQGRFEKVPQLGSVVVQDDVEIGACTTIDRGMIGPTIIGEGTKLDNLVMIGHNCELGRHNIFASQVGLAGSVTTGDYVTCAGQAGIKDHVHLGTGCTLGSKSGVHNDIPAGERQMGIPSRPAQEAFQILAAMSKVPEMRKQLRQLESRLAELELRDEMRKAG